MESFEGLVSIILNPEKSKVLLFKRASNKMFANTFAPVGAGPYKPTENFKQKAIEETKLEAGIVGKFLLEIPAQLYPLGPMTAKLHVFVFETTEDTPVTLNEEHTEYKWVPIQELSQQQYHPLLSSGIQNLLLLLT